MVADIFDKHLQAFIALFRGEILQLIQRFRELCLTTSLAYLRKNRKISDTDSIREAWCSEVETLVGRPHYKLWGDGLEELEDCFG